MRTAVEIAAQVWCDPRCSNIEMDSRLAKVFAEEIEKFLKVVEAAKQLNDENYNGSVGCTRWEDLAEKLYLTLKALEE